MSNYKLMSYNTSWVLDCSSNQFNGALSESAAIMAKMRHLWYNDDKVNSVIDSLNETDKQTTKKMTPTERAYYAMYSDPEYKANLDTYRMTFAEKATGYIRDVGLKDNYDFIALIEQSMHVPKEDLANYDQIMVRNFNLENENENYGYLKRITELGKHPNFSKYTIIKDNVINAGIGAGEGIAIMYKTSLVNTPFTWSFKENPAIQNAKLDVLQKIPPFIFTQDFPEKPYKKDIERRFAELQNKLSKSTAPVQFYSDDLGPYICYDDPKSENRKLIYSKGNGVPDEGRPIIMTGGIADANNTTINLFVAAHGANILNLWTYDVENKKPLQSVKTFINPNEKDQNKKTANEKKLKDLFAKLSKAITDFIQNGLQNVNIQPSVNKVNLFLGGDFNDAWGFILTGLMENGITLTINGKQLTVNFNYPKLKERGTYGNGAGYDLLSCCANKDSIRVPVCESELLGPITPTNPKDKLNMAKRMSIYGDDFYKESQFGYNGDYALFGSTNDTTEYDLRVDNHPLQQIEKTKGDYVIASDHLPVTSMPTTVATKGGKHKRTKRRRNRRTARKLRNKRHYYSRRR